MISSDIDPEAPMGVCPHHHARLRRRPRRPAADRGSAAVELVVLAPVLVVLMLFVVFVGRASGATEQIRHAADEGARAASLANRAAMVDVATAAVQRDLLTNGANCASTSVSVGVADGPAVEAVTVVVTCTVDSGGTNLLGAAQRTVTARSTEVIDRHRAG